MNYIFDNTYTGFLCCVFACFEYKDVDVQLHSQANNNVQSVLFSHNRTIITDTGKAQRVQAGLMKRAGKEVAKDFFRVFLAEDPIAWNSAFRVAYRLFTGQQNILQNYGDADVLYFSQTLKKVSRERHRMKAFIRFSKSSDGLYYSVIEPDFNVLPLIADFFRKRYADQHWLIYDMKREYGLLYDLYGVAEVSLSPAEKNALTTDTVIMLEEREEHFQQLWKRYYHSTNIEARRNMKLHLRHVPKRYWKYLIEKQ